MTYDEAIEWLLSFADFERSGRFQDRLDVAPMLALLERLGNPHENLQEGYLPETIHIAGSKGKGSIAAMVEAVLREDGWCTGLYTSPHLDSYCERIRICGEPIAEDQFARLAGFLRPTVEEVRSDWQTQGRDFVTFDLLTAMGFLEFANDLGGQHCGKQQPIECQIVEVGLGGRVDSTNVFDYKEVAVITPISLEHTAILGDTVEQIAREKAAIITQRAAVVLAPQEHLEATGVVGEKVASTEPPMHGRQLIDVARELRFEKISHDLDGQKIRIEGQRFVVVAKLPLFGAHQMENAATAVAAVDALQEHLFADLPIAKAAAGLASVRWPGRMEVLHERPLVICDGAHNRDSARRLAETLVEYFACDRALFIIGCGSDKDIDGLAEELAPLASHVIAVRAKHPRAMAPERIAEAFGRLNVDTEFAESVSHAVDKAIAASNESALICVAGSLFVAAEAREHFGLHSV